MMRYLLAIGLLLSLLGCDSNTPSTKTILNNTSEDDAMTLALSSPPESAEYLAAKRFVELVDEKTQGEVKIRFVESSSRVSDREMVAAVQKGLLDFTITPTSRLSYIAPDMQLFDLPFLFEDEAAVDRVFDSSAAKLLLSKLDIQGLVGLSLWRGGFKQLMTTSPLEAPEDFQQRRFKIMESPLLREQFKLWGGATVPIAARHTENAFQKEAIDGQEDTIANMAGINVENANVLITNHGYVSFVVAMSLKSHNALSPTNRKAVRAAAKEATAYQYELANQQHAQALDTLKSKATVSNASSTLTRWLKDESDTLLERYRQRLGTAMVEQILQARENWAEPHPEKILVALDADLSGNSANSGLSIRRGIELAIDEINAQGGLLGKEVALVARDNSMIPSRGLDNLETFAELPNLIGVFSGISSPVVLAQLDYIHHKKVLMLAPWAAATPIIDNTKSPNYVFRVSVRDEYAAEFLLNGALEISDNVGLLLVNNGWGRSNYKGLTEALDKRNLSASHIEWFNWGERDFSSKVDRLIKKGADVVIYVGNPVEGEKFVSELAQRVSPPSVISHWGITGSDFAQKASVALERVDLRVLQTFSFIDNNDAEVSDLAKRYHLRYSTSEPTEIVAPSGTAHAYDLMNMLATATTRAGKVDMTRIRNEMQKIDKHSGLMKNYIKPFANGNQDALERSDYIFARYQNGALYPVGSKNTSKNTASNEKTRPMENAP
ncbi:DctP family TRAP transporter solute-binding subunit [Enterovibrio norvegicus]|uniref:DctP family TRAP transporter solute-binding subunit n=1 Tax=Enterovibrio norvegicus TaxID=188144 RepID=UPI00352F2311